MFSIWGFAGFFYSRQLLGIFDRVDSHPQGLSLFLSLLSWLPDFVYAVAQPKLNCMTSMASFAAGTFGTDTKLLPSQQFPRTPSVLACNQAMAMPWHYKHLAGLESPFTVPDIFPSRKAVLNIKVRERRNTQQKSEDKTGQASLEDSHSNGQQKTK